MKNRLFIVAYFLLSVYITFNIASWRKNDMLIWDKGGYYNYLPAAFIYHDLETLGFLDKTDSIYHPNGAVKSYAVYKHPETGRRFTKYTAGVAVCEMPVFLIVHAVNKICGPAPPDGYSGPYQLGIALSTILFTVLGLFFLNSFLSRYFRPQAVLLTLIIIALGTNLYSYTAFDQGMSHTFSFCFFAALMHFSDKWINRGGRKTALLLGFVSGMIVIIRPVNVLVLIVPLIWMIGTRDIWLKRKWMWDAALYIIAFVCILFLQMSYWKYTTGHWIYYAYEEERFFLSKPHIWEGLFSYRKGWFVYTPAAFLAIAGIVFLWKKYRRFSWSLLIFLPVNSYIIFCWHDWAYGGSFGCRPLIESLALLSIPLCALAESVGKMRKPFRTGFYILCGFMIGLNIFQTYQYHHGVIDCCNMNRAYYWRIWGKTEISEADRKLLNR